MKHDEIFDDGLDEELYGDNEDRDNLAGMMELEREQEIFRRGEMRLELEKQFRIFKKLNAKKETNDDNDNDAEPIKMKECYVKMTSTTATSKPVIVEMQPEGEVEVHQVETEVQNLQDQSFQAKGLALKQSHDGVKCISVGVC